MHANNTRKKRRFALHSTGRFGRSSAVCVFSTCMQTRLLCTSGKCCVLPGVWQLSERQHKNHQKVNSARGSRKTILRCIAAIAKIENGNSFQHFVCSSPSCDAPFFAHIFTYSSGSLQNSANLHFQHCNFF